MKNQILKNKDLNDQLKHNGYVVTNFHDQNSLENVFNYLSFQNNEVNFLVNNNPTIDVNFHCTYLDQNKNYKYKLWQLLSNLIKPFLEKTFIDYKIIQANLFNKAPGKGYISPHQNLTTVDEEKYTSISIWIPLQDTNMENGTLCFLPKSQGYFEKYRNSNINWAPMDVSNQLEDFNMVPVNLKVGQVLIFVDSIVHGSPINNSKKNRYVFHYLAIPFNAKPVFCQKIDNVVNLIEVDDMFWQSYSPGDDEPKAPIIKSTVIKEKIYTKTTLLDEMEQ